MERRRFLRRLSTQARSSFFARASRAPTDISRIRLEPPPGHRLSFRRLVRGGSGHAHVAPGANDAPPGGSDRTAARDADELVKILSSAGSGPSVESSLDRAAAAAEASPALVAEVLKKLSNAGALALSFFRWAEKRRRFEYSAESYHALIEALGKIKQFSLVWKVVDEMKRRGLLTKETFGLISRRYARARKVKEAIEAFERM